MDESDFVALYSRYAGSFVAIVAAQAGPSSAADVVHETFEVVWRKRRGAPRNSDEWAPWAFGILRNKVRQELQRRTRKHHDNRFLDDVSPAFAAVEPGDIAEGVVDTQVARSVWETLSADDRELVLVVTNTDLPGAEIAALIGVSHDAYRRRLARLRERIARRSREDAVEGGAL